MARIREFLIEEKTRHGKLRYLFHRRPDGKRMTIKGYPNESGFESQYQLLCNGLDLEIEIEKGARKRQQNFEPPQTLSELCLYHEHHLNLLANRKEMSHDTIKHYKRFTSRFSKEFGKVDLLSIRPHDLTQLLTQWSSTENAWNNGLRSLKHLFKFAEAHWGIVPNPAVGLEKKHVSSTGFEAWTHSDITQYFQTHKTGTMANLAMKLLIHVAPRRSDLVRLGPDCIVEIDGQKFVRFTPQKTKRKSGIPVTIPLREDLESAINLTSIGAQTFLTTQHGKPFSANGFGNRMEKWRKEAGIIKSLGCHGVRKTVGIIMAENDASPYEIMATLGHASPKVTEIYTRGANRRRLSTQGASKLVMSFEDKKDD